ncbi:MAG: efflux RND transporter periplasmic adaptor subunit, partial [Flavobacteriales bacterium]|nr:efflux RND transporter periplasmic adaptor subunit [Flavobacteriales bacterium]
MSKNLKILVVAISASLGLGLLIGKTILNNEVESSGIAIQSIGWTCSMHPEIIKSISGSCSLCSMDLVEMSSNNLDDKSLIQFSDNEIKDAGIETVLVESNEGRMVGVKMPGNVVVDQKNVWTIPAHYPLRLEKLFVSTIGQYVKKGELLAVVYSDEYVQAVRHFIVSLRYKNDKKVKMYQQAVDVLKGWQIPDMEIERLAESKDLSPNANIYAERSGILLGQSANQGAYARKGNVLFEFVDITSVWVEIDANELEKKSFEIGAEVVVNVVGNYSEKYNGKVLQVSKLVDRETNTSKVIIEINNNELKLEPGATVEVMTVPGNLKKLLVPRSSVLWTGSRSLVYV